MATAQPTQPLNFLGNLTPVTTANAPDARVAIAATQRGFETFGYIASDAIATAVYLAQALSKPILVEGPPGVGKTELATATASLLGKPLIRLQCYEGLDEAKALYEWKYGKQLLYTQVLKEKLGDLMAGANGLKESLTRLHEFDDTFFSEEFIEPRPLLKALWAKEGAVLLIDEIDKSDQEFEAFLLELLQDYQISVPELGTIKAVTTPVVFLTSNNTREIGDALKRRCLHLYIPFPDSALEQRIIASRVPELGHDLRRQLVAFVQSLRGLDLKKVPAVSETIDWARTLVLLHATELEPDFVRGTLNVLLKFQEDIEHVDAQVPTLTRLAAQAR
ncbi:MAG: MoxR family ATPase [Gammaproteobacteria bacterium]|nr:MoxR family ATPase [Gammaproteobacteria bacterium]